MKHLEDDILRFCEGSTYSETMYSLVEALCRTHYLRFCAGSSIHYPPIEDYDRKIRESLPSLVEMLVSQINNRFENHINELREECLKKIH